MKRTISLILCLTILLGLLTGLASANEDGTDDPFTSSVGEKEFANIDWLFGSRGVWMKLNGVPVVASDSCEVYLNNPKLGELSYNKDNQDWPWDLCFDTAYPGQEGCIRVKQGENTYSIYVSTATDPVAGLYKNDTYTPDAYLPIQPDAEISYAEGETVSLYVRYASDFGQSVSVTPNLNMGTATKSADGKWIYQPISFTGSGGSSSAGITLNWKSGDENGRLDWNLNFIDLMALMAGNPGDEWMDTSFETWYNGNTTKKFYYRDDSGKLVEVTPENATVSFDRTGMGTLGYSEDRGVWVWDTRSAEFDITGTIKATVGEGETQKTYSMPARVYMPVAMYSGPDGTQEQWLGDNFLFYTEGMNTLTGYICLHPSMREKDRYVRGISFYNPDIGDALCFEITDYGARITVDLTKVPNGYLTTGVAVDVANWGKHRFDLTVTKQVQACEPYKGDYKIPDGLGYVPATPENPRGVYNKQTLVDEENGIYLGVGMVGEGPNGVDLLDSVGVSFIPGSGFISTCAPMFYTLDNGNIVPISDQSSVGATNASVELYPLSADEGNLASENTPVTYAGPSNWPGSETYFFRKESAGDYIVVVRVTIAGMEYTAFGNITVMPPEELFNIYAGSVEDAQAQMETFLKENGPLTERQRLTINFTEDVDLVGPLVFPFGLKGSAVVGSGQTFYGGIEDAGSVENLKFKSLLMKDNAMTAEQAKNRENVSDSVPNYAIYGNIPGGRGGCTFEGFYHAIHVGTEAWNFMVGGYNNTYSNNHVAIYADHDDSTGGGNSGNTNCTFINNDCAVWMRQTSGNKISFAKCKFISNDVDIRNDTDQILWVPMCYFWHGEGSHGIHSDKNGNNWQPVVQPKPQNKHHIPAVIASPAAVNPSCEVKDGYYYPQHIYVSDAIRSLYPIVELENKMAVTALDETENVIATVTLDKAAVQTQGLSLMADGPVNLDGPANLDGPTEEPTVPEAAFDSTMTRVEEDGKVTLSIAAIPEGYTATVEIPCDGWTTAKVLLDGKEVEHVSVADGVVTFEAAASDAATYTIIRDNYVSELKIDGEEAETIPEGEFHLSGTVKVEAVNGNATVMVAGYTKEGKMVLSEIPVLKDGSFDLTVNNTGNLHNLKVFLLNSMENLLPINGVQKVGKP